MQSGNNKCVKCPRTFRKHTLFLLWIFKQYRVCRDVKRILLKLCEQRCQCPLKTCGSECQFACFEHVDFRKPLRPTLKKKKRNITYPEFPKICITCCALGHFCSNCREPLETFDESV